MKPSVVAVKWVSHHAARFIHALDNAVAMISPNSGAEYYVLSVAIDVNGRTKLVKFEKLLFEL
ncbi:hypothetical protein H5410_008672 [Solanum commersonii]|uniref:Uncharacterized protein n=1 Tax=Solanum commersonii TaxID=4109 RepID=A0A9J6AFL8_SOLCO|nr:hypothetical protein H5410_008672 [Solanum commersonii]